MEVKVEVKEPAKEMTPAKDMIPAKEAVKEQEPVKQEQLSVSTELSSRSDDPLYEPVSPTPLPDSPCDEAKPAAQEQKIKPSPFQEVINKKAGVEEAGEAARAAAAKKPKKQSAAEKKRALNSKGEKGRDLLDVFTQEVPPAAAVKEQEEKKVKIVRKSPTPEVKKPIEEEVVAVTESLEKVVLNNVSAVEKAEEVKKEEVKPVESVPVKVEVKAEVESEEPKEELKVEPKVESAPAPVPTPAAVPKPAPKQNGIPSLLDNIPMELRRTDSIKVEKIEKIVVKVEKEEKEEGEISDNDDENENPVRDPKLKYDYKDDQWSPLNPEGKKQCDREFLICLQRDPLSLTKPNNLPAMEIVKDKPNQMGRPQTGSRIDFTPGFVIRTSSTRGGRGNDGPRGASREGGGGRDRREQRGGPPLGPGGKPRMIISLPSIGQEVKLNKAENAWKPTVKDPKAAKEEADDVVTLKKNVIAILNKLTPQKFDTLVEKFGNLPITSQERLQVCMELIFEKAVDEPGFSVAYAKMCQTLQLKKVPTDESEGRPEAEVEFVNFRKLLISRCQKEFEKDYMETLDRDKYRTDMAAAATENDRKQIKAVFEQMEMKLRRRSLGNIRFIGELYKLQMLTARIMHECVKKLLKTTDEESLECLCRLLTTVGQDLENETSARLIKGPINGLNELAVYFKEMKKITEDKKICSRIRFLMQVH